MCLGFLLCLFLLYSPIVDGRGSSNSVVTIMGTGLSSSLGTGGRATSATLSSPRCVQQDTAGDIYVLEQGGRCVRKIGGSDSIVQNYAGVCGSGGSSGDSGAASSALFETILSIFVSTIGAAYISDNYNVKVYKVSSDNIRSTFAGTGSDGPSGDGGQATAANLFQPYGVWGNTIGVIYSITEVGLVRSISTAGIITTFAGTAWKSFFFFSFLIRLKVIIRLLLLGMEDLPPVLRSMPEDSVETPLV